MHHRGKERCSNKEDKGAGNITADIRVITLTKPPHTQLTHSLWLSQNDTVGVFMRINEILVKEQLDPYERLGYLRYLPKPGYLFFKFTF